MYRILSSTLPLLFATMSLAWVPSPSSIFTRTGLSSPTSTAIPMALDYNNPVVGEEFAAVQTLTYEEVEEELLESGVAGSPSMNEMDIKLMLVEVRLRKSGKMPGQEKKSRKDLHRFLPNSRKLSGQNRFLLSWSKKLKVML